MKDLVLSPTPYDDVFRTLLNNCSQLILPVINELFEENYTGDETIIFFPNEHFQNTQGGNEQKRITDTSFSVIGNTAKRYHFECQSTVDYSILIRIFEYDAQIALDQGSEVTGNKIIVSFPNTAVLYLRSTSKTPDAMEIIIRTPGGETSYPVPVMKIKAYSITEIFEKNLLFLIPFYIFTYESQFDEIEGSEDKLTALKSEYERIKLQLEWLEEKHVIDEFYKKTIVDMSERVLKHLAVKYENILKGVGTVMVGQLLDYEAKRILDKGFDTGFDKGFETGEISGKKKGRAEGIIGTVSVLRSLGIDDRTIMEKLQEEFHLSKKEAETFV